MPNRLRCAAVAFLLALTGAAVPAGAWPDKPLRIYVGFAAGGGTDRVARVVAEALRAELNNQQIIIDNRAGESGGLAIDALKAATDDHTLMLYADEFLTVPLVKQTRYRTLRDLKPISLIAEGNAVLAVGSQTPYKTFEAFTQFARANPGKITYATSGKGTKFNLLGEYVSRSLQLGMVHVDTRGQGRSVNDLMDGQLTMTITGLPPVIRGLRNGELRGLAVTGPTRDPRLPNAPTLEEVGFKGFNILQRFGLVAPLSMPDELVDKIAHLTAKALSDPQVIAQLEQLGMVAHPSTPEQYRQSIARVIAQWEGLIKEKGLTGD